MAKKKPTIAQQLQAIFTGYRDELIAAGLDRQAATEQAERMMEAHDVVIEDADGAKNLAEPRPT